MSNELQINDPVNINIMKNGYWVDGTKGKIVGETAKFWIVESGSHHFWDSEKGEFINRRFIKTGGALSKRHPKG